MMTVPPYAHHLRQPYVRNRHPSRGQGVESVRPTATRSSRTPTDRLPGRAWTLSVGVSVEDPNKHHDGTITSGHGTQVIAFTPGGDKGRVVYTHGTTVGDFAPDLPLLTKNALADHADVPGGGPHR